MNVWWWQRQDFGVEGEGSCWEWGKVGLAEVRVGEGEAEVGRACGWIEASVRMCVRSRW